MSLCRLHGYSEWDIGGSVSPVFSEFKAYKRLNQPCAGGELQGGSKVRRWMVISSSGSWGVHHLWMEAKSHGLIWKSQATGTDPTQVLCKSCIRGLCSKASVCYSSSQPLPWKFPKVHRQCLAWQSSPQQEQGQGATPGFPSHQPIQCHMALLRVCRKLLSL